MSIIQYKHFVNIQYNKKLACQITLQFFLNPNQLCIKSFSNVMYNVSNGTLEVGQAVQYKACALSLKTTEGNFSIGGREGVEPIHSHTEIFIFAAISRATDVRFLNVFISLDLSFH